jgi:hypothetical protein
MKDMLTAVIAPLLAGLLVGLAGGWIGGRAAEDREFDRETREWLAERDSLRLTIGVKDAERVLEEAENQRLNLIITQLTEARPVPVVRPGPEPIAPPPAGSDAAKHWEQVARSTRASLDSTREDLSLAVDRIRDDSTRLAAVRDSAAKLDARRRATILELTAERDTALALLERAPVGDRRCRIPLIGLRCPSIHVGYGATGVRAADADGSDRWVVKTGPTVAVGWTISLGGGR